MDDERSWRSMGLQIYIMRSKRKMRYQRQDLEAIICIKLPGPWKQKIWKQIGTNVAGEYAASTFRTEMSQVGKVAGYTNPERKRNVTEWYWPFSTWDRRKGDEGQMPIGNWSWETPSSLGQGKWKGTHVSAREVRRHTFFSLESDKANMFQ
jgi:hypothetical protein